jgi:hypothetical protein
MIGLLFIKIQGDNERKKYRLAKWSVVCRPKDLGGLGIQDLLGKWLFKLLTEDGIWETLIIRKYIDSKAFSQVSWKPGDSNFWASLMAMKKLFFLYGSFPIIRDESEIRFWEDQWLGTATLHE